VAYPLTGLRSTPVAVAPAPAWSAPCRISARWVSKSSRSERPVSGKVLSPLGVRAPFCCSSLLIVVLPPNSATKSALLRPYCTDCTPVEAIGRVGAEACSCPLPAFDQGPAVRSARRSARAAPCASVSHAGHVGHGRVIIFWDSPVPDPYCDDNPAGSAGRLDRLSLPLVGTANGGPSLPGMCTTAASRA